MQFQVFICSYFNCFFAGGRFYDLFPLRGLFSENFDELSLLEKIKDYFWHLTLPLIAMLVSGLGFTFNKKHIFRSS